MSRNASIIAAAVTVTALMSLLAVTVAGAAEAGKDADAAPATAPAAVAVRKIEIKNRKYSPSKLTIKAGQTVVWTNRDDSDHTIVADDGSFGTEENDLSRGESYRFTFSKAGKFRYRCKYHPREKGEILVE